MSEEWGARFMSVTDGQRLPSFDSASHRRGFLKRARSAVPRCEWKLCREGVVLHGEGEAVASARRWLRLRGRQAWANARFDIAFESAEAHAQ